nr:cellulose binding domain-containing protein [Micromonospora sp. DSM 115978]
MTAAATLAVVAAVLLAPATPAYAATTATFTKTSEWGGGYVGQFTVHNDSATPLTGWRVEFDLPAGTSVGSHWNATLTRSGDRYVFTNLAWNGVLAPGASTGFGWVAGGTGVPSGCVLNGGSCDGGPGPEDGPDVSPPGKPANIRISTASQTVTVSWDPATDDRGVVRYDVVSNGTAFRSVTEPTFSMPIPPPMLFTFGISAVDAAGNRSPYGIFYLGRPTDRDAPTAPTGLTIANLAGDHLSVRWTAATDDIFVAGYEVYLNDRLISRVGGTSGFVPYTGYGVYWVKVRAFDHEGTLSPYASLGLAVDPPFPHPPPTTPPPTTS